MQITRRTFVAALFVMLAIGNARADQGEPASRGVWATKVLAERYSETLKLIKPQPGESRWMEIPWQTSLWTARQKAAAEGKPMFVWSGSGGAPCAPT